MATMDAHKFNAFENLNETRKFVQSVEVSRIKKIC